MVSSWLTSRTVMPRLQLSHMLSAAGDQVPPKPTLLVAPRAVAATVNTLMLNTRIPILRVSQRMVLSK